MIKRGGSCQGYRESVGSKDLILSPSPPHLITSATHPGTEADVGITGVPTKVTFQEIVERLLCQDPGCIGDGL